jgi:hypothetical protein
VVAVQKKLCSPPPLLAGLGGMSNSGQLFAMANAA